MPCLIGKRRLWVEEMDDRYVWSPMTKFKSCNVFFCDVLILLPIAVWNISCGSAFPAKPTLVNLICFSFLEWKWNRMVIGVDNNKTIMLEILCTDTGS